MNEPFLLSNLVELQDLDNKIYKLIDSKSNGENVINLKSLELNYKELSEKITENKKELSEFFLKKEDNEKKIISLELQIKEIEKKLSGDTLDPSETLNYSNQKESLKIQIDKLKLELEELKEQNGDQLQVMNDWENSLEDIKNQLINLSKIVKNEWDKIDKQIPDLEKEKLEFISTFPDELKDLYDNLKKRGLEVIAAYRNENQCGCCGVELTSSEIEQILKTKFQQCSYCDGVVI
jgi:predicted  nucleic acid-binding Zn-ribbon protein|tara:strand:- start:74 stop:781 length:708 start_codon:yes stop_codon:yes gene_type:complete